MNYNEDKETKMLGGKLKYILGGVFLLVLLVLVAEAGFYFGAKTPGKIIPPSSLTFEAPGAFPIIDQNNLAGFEFVKRGLVKGLTIETQLEGTVTKIKGPDWFAFENNGETMGYKVLPEEPAMDYSLIREGTGEKVPVTWQDLRVGDRIIITSTYDNDTGKIVSHSLTIFRQE